jgi:hypothetical protein
MWCHLMVVHTNQLLDHFPFYVDISHFKTIYSWLNENNPIYLIMADIPNCPTPITSHATGGLRRYSAGHTYK